MASTAWADQIDDDDTAQNEWISPKDADGNYTVTTFEEKEIDGAKRTFKLVEHCREVKQTRLIKPAAAVRAQWPTFGIPHDAVKPKHALDEVFFELPQDAEDDELQFWEEAAANVEKLGGQKAWTAARDEARAHDVLLGAGDTAKIGGQVGAALPGASGYVPPAMRDKGHDNQFTLKLAQISEDAQEGDISRLCEQFGKCRSRLLKHKDGPKAGLNKGLAFVQYTNQGDADRALVGLDGHGYDNLILRASWAERKQ